MLILCGLAEQELTRRLKKGLTAESCGTAFRVAGAWLALSGYAAGDGGGLLKAGDLTLDEGMTAAQRAELLRRQAELLLAPFIKDEGFAFLGVRG